MKPPRSEPISAPMTHRKIGDKSLLVFEISLKFLGLPNYFIAQVYK